MTKKVLSKMIWKKANIHTHKRYELDQSYRLWWKLLQKWPIFMNEESKEKYTQFTTYRIQWNKWWNQRLNVKEIRSDAVKSRNNKHKHTNSRSKIMLMMMMLMILMKRQWISHTMKLLTLEWYDFIGNLYVYICRKCVCTTEHTVQSRTEWARVHFYLYGFVHDLAF